MSLPTNDVILSTNPPPTAEIENIFPKGKLEGRTISSNWKELSLPKVIGLATGVLAITALAAYKYCSQDYQEFQVPEDMCPAPRAIFEYQAKNKRYDGITPKQMESYYGSGKRSLTSDETRELYHEILDANLEFSKKALENNIGNPTQTGRNSYNTRSDARAYVRELGPEGHQRDAEYRDRLVYGSKTGPSFDQISEKYKGDPLKIVEAAGRSNEKVNWLVKHISDDNYSQIPENVRRTVFIDLPIKISSWL